jgi:hypothetical protein
MTGGDESMDEQASSDRFIEAVGLSMPASERATLAAEFTSLIEQIRTLDDLDLDGDSLSPCFDVRWNR